MHTDIAFPHLNIELAHVGKSISIFGFEIAYYGMIIGTAILIGIFLAVREARRTHQNPDHYFDLAIYGVIFSILCARIYYVIFSWDMYKGNLLSIFNLRQGGLAIYGGIIGAVITGVVYAKRHHLRAPLIFDTVAVSIVNGQMLGRWGNFFNREAFGEYTDGLFAMRLPVDAVRASDITQKMQEHMEKIDGVRYIQVHPTFLYESLWCLALLIILLLYRQRKRYEGEVFLVYLFGYGLGRVWIEGLRTDQLKLPLVGWPVSQVLAGLIVIGVGAVLVYNRKNLERLEYAEFQRRRRERERRLARRESGEYGSQEEEKVSPKEGVQDEMEASQNISEKEAFTQSEKKIAREEQKASERGTSRKEQKSSERRTPRGEQRLSERRTPREEQRSSERKTPREEQRSSERKTPREEQRSSERGILREESTSSGRHRSAGASEMSSKDAVKRTRKKGDVSRRTTPEKRKRPEGD